MKIFLTETEQKYWFATLVVLLGIYSTLGLAGQFASFFIERALFDLLFILGFLLTGLVVIGFGVRKKSSLTEWLLYLTMFVIVIMIFTRSGVSLAERTHLFEYGLVGVLIFKALQERGKSLFSAAIYAFILTSFAGAIDEFIQFFLPNRVFDYLDIIRNTGAAFIGIGINFFMLALNTYRNDR